MWRQIHGEKDGMRAPTRQTNVPVRLHGDAHRDKDKRWKLLPVSLGWSCRGRIRGAGIWQHGLEGVCGDALCILGQFWVCQKAGKRSSLQTLHQTFPRAGDAADRNR